MKTIAVKDLKAHWAQIEAQVKAGETFEVLNRGKVAAHVVPPAPRPVLGWPDHPATAHGNPGRKGAERAADSTSRRSWIPSRFMRQAALAQAEGQTVRLVASSR
jgi:antitoxin (DNA-binding transcriptional repressor) of toxin-antitoxin stability system